MAMLNNKRVCLLVSSGFAGDLCLIRTSRCLGVSSGGAHESVGKLKPINYRRIEISTISKVDLNLNASFKLMIPVGKIIINHSCHS